MKLFGEYLVEKNIVSTEQLVAALIRQSSKLPGMAELAYNKKILRPDQLLKIFKHQNENKSGFIEAAKALNIWNSDLANKFDKNIEESRIPLVQILMDMEITKLDTITHALDDFLGEVQDSVESGQHTLPQTGPAAVETNNDVVENQVIQESIEASDLISSTISDSVSEIKMETVPEKQMTPSYEGYCQIFTEEKKVQIENYLTQLQNGGISISVMNSLKDSIHELVTASRTNSANLSYSVLHGLESMVDQILKTPATNINEDFITKIGKVNLDAIRFLWQIVEQLKTGIHEEDLISQPEMRKTFDTIAAAVEITRFDLDFLA